MSEENWRKTDAENFYYHLYCPTCGLQTSLQRHVKGCKELLMNFNEYQKAAMRTAAPTTTERDALLVSALGLAGESGEVVELIKKHTFHGRPLNKFKIAGELGDVLWYIARMATALGIELQELAKGNIEKLGQRYPNGFTPNVICTVCGCEGWHSFSCTNQ